MLKFYPFKQRLNSCLHSYTVIVLEHMFINSFLLSFHQICFYEFTDEKIMHHMGASRKELHIPLRSLLTSIPPTQAALYPFGGALVTTLTMVTVDWVGFWSMWMGWTWPPPPATKARVLPEGSTVGWAGAAMMTGWALTGEPTQNQQFYHVEDFIYVPLKKFCLCSCVRRCMLTWGALRVPVLGYRCQFAS